MKENLINFNKLKEASIIFLLVFLFWICSFRINKNCNILSFINNARLIKCSLYISSFLVVVLSDKRYINNLYKYLAAGFSSIAVLETANIFLINSEFLNINSFNFATRLFYISKLFEIVIIILAFINTGKNKTFKEISINITLATVVVTYLLFQKNLPIIKNLELQYMTTIRFLNELLILILYIVLIFIIMRNSNKISKIVLSDFIRFIIFRGLAIIFVMATTNIVNDVKIFIVYTILFIGDYFIFKIMVLEIIKRPQQTLYNELILKSKELEEKLEELKRESDEKEAKKEFLANISHEFKTPVNVIYSAIQMQDIKRASNDVDEILKFNFIIKQNCYRLIRLINNFIDSSKLTDQEYKLKLRCMNIVSIVENTTMSILTFATMKNIEVIFDTQEEEIFILGDKDLIERSILNILSNSIKYNKESGSINVFIISKGDNVIIEIKDSGIGIPKDKQKEIFNRYERVNTTAAKYKEGTGLGLNIVKEIINKLNGKIEIESEEGSGTTIRLILPKTEYKEEIYDEYLEDYNLKNDIMKKVDLEMSDICI